MQQNDLTFLRKHINELDAQLVELLNQRAAAALQIGELKAVSGGKVYDPAREREVLQHIDGLNQGPLSKGAMEEVFAAIITVCREIQMASKVESAHPGS
jgi:chorismate mutase-like protein